MKLYSDGNSNPFVNSPLRDIAPVWDQESEASDAKFGGIMLQLEDSRTMVFLTAHEVKAINALAYLGET